MVVGAAPGGRPYILSSRFQQIVMDRANSKTRQPTSQKCCSMLSYKYEICKVAFRGLPFEQARLEWHSINQPSRNQKMGFCRKTLIKGIILFTMHYGIKAMGAMTLRISELYLSFSPHPNISDGNFNLVQHFFRIQIFQINEKGSR